MCRIGGRPELAGRAGPWDNPSGLSAERSHPMAHAPAAPPAAPTIADLLARLGDIPPERVRAVPPPGTATEADVIAIRERERRLYELVDGTLVEKAMGAPESVLAWVLGVYLGIFLREHD